MKKYILTLAACVAFSGWAAAEPPGRRGISNRNKAAAVRQPRIPIRNGYGIAPWRWFSAPEKPETSKNDTKSKPKK